MRNMLLRPLKRLSPKFKRKDFIGFDIETRDNNKVMLLATMSFSDGTVKSFETKEDFIHEMMKREYKGKIFCASFMEFDALGIFRGTEYEYKVTPFNRNNFIFMMKTYVEDGELVRKPKNTRDKKSYWPITMVDTMAYAPVSVESLGKIIGIPKMSHPGCFNRIPQNFEEWKQLTDYCANDSLISRKTMEFFHDSFIKDLKVKPRLTIASTAMDDFRRNHMTDPLKRMSDEDIEFSASGYFGALNGVFKRGMFDAVRHGKKLYYHDVNNMYGSVMVDIKLPHPNYMRHTHVDDMRYIINYEGMSKVDIACPATLKYPILPFRDDKTKRVIYPIGSWTGTFSHLILRKALEQGYQVKKVHSSLYSTATIQPFKHIKDYYMIRKQLKKEGNPLNEVYKLIINATYGKWGEMGKKNKRVIPVCEAEIGEIMESANVEEKNGYYFLDPPKEDYKAHCNPLWAGYITDGARIKLNGYMVSHDPYYVDTDSIICDHLIEDSDELGRLKVEMIVDKAFFLRSKFYMCLPVGWECMDEVTLLKNSKTKIKGVPHGMLVDGEIEDATFPADDLARYKDHKLTPQRFMDIVSMKKVEYKKFMRFKESIRRGKMQNEAIIQSKRFDLEDTKRIWPDPLSFIDCHGSSPLCVIDGMLADDHHVKVKDGERWHPMMNGYNISISKHIKIYKDVISLG